MRGRIRCPALARSWLATVLLVLAAGHGFAGKPKKIRMVTNYGTIVLELYDATPKHRDNFLKLVHRHVFDSLRFHRRGALAEPDNLGRTRLGGHEL